MTKNKVWSHPIPARKSGRGILRNHNKKNSERKAVPWTVFLISSFVMPNSSERGQALITAVVFFLIIATTISIGVINPVLRQVNQGNDFVHTRAALFVSQSVNEDALYRLMHNKKFASPSRLFLNGYTAIATSTVVADGILVDSSGGAFNLTRNIETHLTAGSGAAFHYGAQTDNGGLELDNSSSVSGNVYSNGPVEGKGGGNGNLITGSVVSAGLNGSVAGIHATSSVYAHTITKATIDGDAYYNSISGSTVKGALHPGSADQATSSLPISDAMIANWENNAAAGGTISSPCPYQAANGATLGPIKINCDLEIKGSSVTLAGPIWVVGNINISSQNNITVSSSLGKQSVQVIADNPSNHSTGSTIIINNNSQFWGSGAAGSYILMLSQNNSAENDGDTTAIILGNGVSGELLLYARHGLIKALNNNSSIKEVAAYKVKLDNSSNILYQTGLANLIFSSGPGGGYVFDKWREVQ